MSEAAFSEEEPDISTDDVRDVIEEWLDDLVDRPLSNSELNDLLADREDNIQSSALGMKPETHLEENLLDPLFETLGIEYDSQAYGQSGGNTVWPDFKITNVDPVVIGESKKYNNFEEGVSEVKEYLDRKSIGADYGIVTDGFEWNMWKIEVGDVTKYPEVTQADVDLRDAILEIARDIGAVSSRGITDVDVDELLQEFISAYEHTAFDRLVSQTAPRQIRDNRKRDVEEFYDLYIELLFGEGDEYEEYETSLLDDIEQPKGTDGRDKRLFAVTLMNRLLFVKFLESRDVLDEGFLSERVRFYQEHSDDIAGTLYSSQIKPIFYNLLNTDERKLKYRSGWFDQVPYLNGGLFRASIHKEKEFDVGDRILPEVIDDLIEGSKLNLSGDGYDPAIIGSVFEKTINHIEKERNSSKATQKEKGAYYTPTDITELVIERAVDPKVRDVLAETFTDYFETDLDLDEDELETVEGYLEALTLPDLLQLAEDEAEVTLAPGPDQIRLKFEGEALETAEDSLTDLTVLDPACGSGHFLTAAMEEVHRAQMSLRRGQSDNGDPEPKKRFEMKRELALSSIYGIDADRVATEIAKLRVWLKIVEGNGWEAQFGKLPNIDVNIRDGNALIGLPLQGTTDTSLDLPMVKERIDDILDLRMEYKDDNIDDKDEIEQMEKEIRPELDEAFIDQLNYIYKTTPEGPDDLKRIFESIDGSVHHQVEEIQLKRKDRENLSDDEKETFSEHGFGTHKISVSLDVKDRERSLRDDNDVDKEPKEALLDELLEFLEGDYECTRIQRRPLSFDLSEEQMFGHPAHWFAEFPEARPDDEDSSAFAVDFDIIIGNPPYGDILSESEDVLTDTYQTAGEDVVALFLERQLSLLAEDGYIGNVASLKIAYKDSMDTLNDIYRKKLDTTSISCFAKRPSHIFEGAEVRIAILSGKKDVTDGEDENIETSEFIRFNEDDRDERIRNLPHRPVDDYILKDDGINGSEDYVALPKIGTERIEGIMSKLRDEETIIKERTVDSDTGNVIWRREGQDYFVNPMREELYSAREVRPFYFDTELEARTAFLATGSNLFYLYWCVYGDMFHVNLSHIRCFPLPSLEDLQEHEDEIIELSDDLWEVMEDGFKPSSNTFTYKPMKPHIDKADDLLGPLYGLDDDEIRFLQEYHTQYGRSGPADYSLDEWLSDEDEEDDDDETEETDEAAVEAED
ncbi:Eco57I restriction-modification methylase domain-containing protein [Halorubrum xinjiangense]|uniref:Eco57I restriction-modification methylase domain-containing protein n=1 Tax=Halorubrum xinjiangense TaxID=261291 RepID=UPI003C704956